VGQSTSSGEQSDLRTFLIADVRGYTHYTREFGDEAASELAATFAETVRESLGEFGGQLVELRGDEALCVFGSARQALRAAIALQRNLRTALPLGVGIGLDAGEAVPTEGGYRGGALNMAARLCAKAGPGRVLATETVVHLAQRLPGVAYGAPRPMRLKGMEGPTRVHEISSTEPMPAVPIPDVPRSGGGRRRLVIGVAVAVLVAAIIAVAAQMGSSTSAGVHVRPNSVAVIDPATNRVVADIPVSTRPLAAVAAYGALWVAGENTVTRVDLKTRHPSTIPVDGSPSAMAAGGGYVWAYDTDAKRIFRIDKLGSPDLTRTLRFPSCCSLKCAGIAVQDNTLWASDGGVDVHTHNFSVAAAGWHTLPGSPYPANDVAAGNGFVYAADNNGVFLIRPGTPAEVGNPQTIAEVGNTGYPIGLHAADDQVWAVSPANNSTIVRFDSGLSTNRSVPATQPPGDTEVTTGSGAAWVSNVVNGEVYRVDPSSMTITKSISMGKPRPTDVVWANGRVWVPVVQASDAPQVHYCYNY
jgi:YVTN family beta-propeller protein